MMNKLVNQEGRESYGDETSEGVTAILQGSNEFVGSDKEFEAERTEENVFDAVRAEESTERERSQRSGNLFRHATGTAKEREEDEAEGNVAGNHMQPARNPVDQATGEVETTFGGGNG